MPVANLYEPIKILRLDPCELDRERLTQNGRSKLDKVQIESTNGNGDQNESTNRDCFKNGTKADRDRNNGDQKLTKMNTKCGEISSVVRQGGNQIPC